MIGLLLNVLRRRRRMFQCTGCGLRLAFPTWDAVEAFDAKHQQTCPAWQHYAR